MAERTRGRYLPFPTFGPLYRMLEASGTPVSAYTQQRTSLEFDSFRRLSTEQRVSLWGRRRTSTCDERTSERDEHEGSDRNSGPNGSRTLRSVNGNSAEEAEVVERRRRHQYRRALLTYVLGIDPPRGIKRRFLRGRLRQPQHHPYFCGEIRLSHESSWGMSPAGASQYGRWPSADEVASATIPMLSMSAASDENRIPASSFNSPFVNINHAGFLRPQRGLQDACSHCPECCCTDCAEELVESRRAGNQAHRVSKNPYRVLDAPSLPDDFYLNVVDWSGADCVAVGLKGSVLLWNARTSMTEVLFSKSGSAYEEIANVSFSPLDSAILCVGFRNGRVELWDVTARKKVRTLSGHKSRCSVSAWSSRQMFLSTGARDQSILNRDLRCREPFISAFKYHQSELCGLHLSPSERLLASGGNDNLLCVWDVRRTFSSRPCATECDYSLNATADSSSHSFLHLSERSARGLHRVDRDGSAARDGRRGSSWSAVNGASHSDSVSDEIGGSTVTPSSASPVDAAVGVGLELSPRLSVSTLCPRMSPPSVFAPVPAGVANDFPLFHNLFPYGIESQPGPQGSPQSVVARHPASFQLHRFRQAQIPPEGIGQQTPHSAISQPSPPSASPSAASVRGSNATSPLFVYKEHHAAVKAVRFSCHVDGLLASGGGTADRHIRFWNTNIGTTRSVYRVDTGCQVCNVVFSRNSCEFISSHGFSLNQIFVWDYSPTALTSSLPTESEGIFGRTLLASFFESGHGVLHSSPPPVQKVTTLTGHSARVLFLATSPCGTCVVTGAGRGDETLKFWRVFPLTTTGPEDDLDDL